MKSQGLVAPPYVTRVPSATADSLSVDVTLRLNEGMSVREAVVSALLERIRSGALPAGTQLPPERVLAAQLKVSRGTLREAVRILDHTGVLEVRTRAGAYVSSVALSKSIELRARAALSGQESPIDIMVVRRALEPTAARYAALNRHVRDLTLLRESVRKQRQLIRRGENPDEVDRGFHVAVANASRNPLLHALFVRVADAMQQQMWIELKHRSLGKAGNQELYVHQHRLILDAIERGDSAAAAQTMIAHLDAVEEGLLSEAEMR